MTFSVSTTGVEKRWQIEYWRDVICARFVPLELELPQAHPPQFRARVTVEDLDLVEVATVTSDPHAVFRSPKAIRESDSDDIFVMIARRGHVQVAQDGRAAVLQPGDLATYDSARPCRIIATDSFQLVVVKIPRSAFALRCLPEPEPDTTATAIRGDSGIGALVSPFLLSLAEHSSKLPRDVVGRLGVNALELVSAALSMQAGGRPRAAVPRAAHRLRAQRYITDHLGDSELTPGAVATALGVSVRYLHLLFQEETTSPGRWMTGQRLTRAAQALRDPRQTDRTITEIAFRFGFKDAAHFSRAFKASYGLSPREYRRQARPPEVPGG